MSGGGTSEWKRTSSRAAREKAMEKKIMREKERREKITSNSSKEFSNSFQFH